MNKRNLLILLLFGMTFSSQAGQVGVGVEAPDDAEVGVGDSADSDASLLDTLLDLFTLDEETETS